ELELALAENHWTRLQIRDAEARYNKMSIDEVRALMGDIDYDAMAEVAGITAADYVIVNTPSYIEALGEMYTDVELATWKDYLQVRLLSGFASRLHSSVADRQFDFYSTTLSGTPEQQERW